MFPNTEDKSGKYVKCSQYNNNGSSGRQIGDIADI